MNRVELTFIGARELVQLALTPVIDTFELSGRILPEPKAVIALALLRDYYAFITLDDNKRENFFDANVRAYQGDVHVNEAIAERLRTPAVEDDFWWFNNGITIVCESVKPMSTEQLAIKDPQIINGHQTSHEIYNYFKGLSAAQRLADSRRIAIKIIETDDAGLRDNVIRAANSQTKIPFAYLWSTDEVHRSIEATFVASNLYYDRRKNQWKTAGIPADHVVGITELAQSVAAVLLQEPDHARARPVRYFKDKKEYKKIFAESKIRIYVEVARLRKHVEAFLSSTIENRQHRNNLLFYVMMVAVCIRFETPRPGPKKLQALSDKPVTDIHLAAALGLVKPLYEKHGGDDKAAKGPELRAELKALLIEQFT